VEHWETLINHPPIFEPGCYGIPKKYRDCSLENYLNNDRIVNSLKKYTGGGLVFQGPTGCGKTHLAIGIMRQVEVNEWRIHCRRNINFLKDGKELLKGRRKKKLFITVPELLLEIRGSFQSDAEYSEMEILNKYSTVPLLVLDDLGSEKASEYTLTTLYILIDRRYREEMDTIITTNLSGVEIEDHLNARIASRLAGMKNIKINTMPDYRKKRS